MNSKRLMPQLAILGVVLATSATSETMQTVYDGEFPRLDFETVMPTGQSVAKECQDESADYPYEPYDWPRASANLTILQGGGNSQVVVSVQETKPNTLYTMWVRLRGFDNNGKPFGGNPLVAIPGKPEIGIPGNPLIPSSHLAKALDAVHEPTPEVVHGFVSDSEGSGGVTIDLDFPIVGGSYPFHKISGYDPAKMTLAGARTVPVAIVGGSSGAPFTLRLASHCVDGLSHGLLPGPHEGWFDWKMP